jgi:hypothetical protein
MGITCPSAANERSRHESIRDVIRDAIRDAHELALPLDFALRDAAQVMRALKLRPVRYRSCLS